MAEFRVGDIVKMKKQHPCGTDLWKVTRVGMDFRIKCTGCARSIMLARSKFEKAVKEVVERGE